MRPLPLALILSIGAAGLPPIPVAHAGEYWDAFVREYVQRLDGISPEAGDAEAVNTATHMIDPWPPYAANRHIKADGARFGEVIERYRDVRKLPLAPPPISQVPIGSSGLGNGSTGAVSGNGANAGTN